MWERGRARLQNYLKEIGWTETIIDVRSKCTRNLLKLGNAEQEENISPNINGTETNNKRASESQGDTFITFIIRELIFFLFLSELRYNFYYYE